MNYSVIFDQLPERTKEVLLKDGTLIVNILHIKEIQIKNETLKVCYTPNN